MHFSKFSKMAAALLFSFITTSTIAQHRVDVRAGVNVSSWTHSDDSGKQDAVNEGVESYTGFQIGGNYEYIISDLMSIQSGLLFEVRGTKYNYPDPNTPSNYNRSQWNPAYLIIPLHAKASFETGEVHVIAFTGPSIGIGIAGNKSYEIKNGAGDPETGESPIEWGDGKDLRGSDFGWNIGTGVEIQNFQVGLQYCFGIQNINGQSDINKIKQNVLNFYLAYTLLNDD